MINRNSVGVLGITLLVASGLALPAGAVGASPPGPSRAGIIVWTHRTPAGPEQLLIADADGSHQRALTPALPDAGDIDAQISPNGRWIAYEHDDPVSGTIHLVHPDGSDDHVFDVGCFDPCAATGSPTWLSNDRLAFVLVNGPFDPDTGNAASAVLWSAHVDGSEIRRLSPRGIEGVYEENYLHVARDHSYVTFRRTRNSDGASALFRRSIDRSSLQQLTPWALRAEVNDLSTASSGPTKDLIVFESYGRGDPDATFVDIATVPATCPSLSACTAQIHWLTDNGATGRRNANPQWSPNGSSLVFTDRSSIDEPNVEIWTMRYGGTERRKISTSVDFDYRPTWGRSLDND